jgi:hypothetical protein
MNTTISISVKTTARLKEQKVSKYDTYDEIINRMIDNKEKQKV